MSFTRGLVLISIVAGLALSLPACKRSKQATLTGAGPPATPCAIYTRPASAEDDGFVKVVNIERTDDGELLTRIDTSQDGEWDTCMTTRWTSESQMAYETDRGCDGTVNSRGQYARNPNNNTIQALIGDETEVTYVVSPTKQTYFSEYTSLTLYGAPSNYRLETDEEGRVSNLVDHGQNTRFFYDKAGRLLKILGHDGSIAAYEYDQAGNLTLVHWFKRDLLVKLAYTCDANPS